MHPIDRTLHALLLPCATISLLIAAGCDSGSPEPASTPPAVVESPTVPPPISHNAAQPPVHAGTTAPSLHVDGYQFVFDTSKYTATELLAFLERADEVAGMSLAEFDDLNIAVVLQGSNIAMFARQNYEYNKKLVDLAARLDALRVIDLKICQHDLYSFGFSAGDFPAFIDRIPQASAEMQRLEDAGYFML